MSSAILYLAIVAIWACVLIPRWLKRDSARGTTAPDSTAPADTPVHDDDADIGEAGLADDPAPAHRDANGAPRQAADASAPPRRSASPLSPEESRRRVLAGRRRLLGMLVVLEIAAITLAVGRLAALWVIIPPSIMLIGYLLLLREAAHADAERAQREAETATRTREHARTRAARRVTQPESAPADDDDATAAALAAKFAASPVPADYEDAGPGRDFAPGLAGKYTASNADEEYDSYEEPRRLRAVGD